MTGINRALLNEAHFDSLIKSASVKPCIFLSHITADKTAVREIGNYIMNNGDIDIYLDENDANLQQAVNRGDAILITRFLEIGLSRSSHIMCLVSDQTIRSWWVPYELGFAKRAGKPLSTLRIKGNAELPAYLEISQVIKNTQALNSYLQQVIGHFKSAGIKSSVLNESLIGVGYGQPKHPLDNYLDRS